MAIVPSRKIWERNSAVIEFDLTDIDGTTSVGVSNISTATLTLRNKSNGAIINSCQDRDVKTSIDVAGHAIIVLSPDDNPIVSQDRAVKQEVHVASISISYSIGTRQMVLTQEIWLYILNLDYEQ